MSLNHNDLHINQFPFQSTASLKMQKKQDVSRYPTASMTA